MHLVLVLWKGCEDAILLFRLDFNCLCLVVQVRNIVACAGCLCILSLNLVCHIANRTFRHVTYHIRKLLHGIRSCLLVYIVQSLVDRVIRSIRASIDQDIGDGFQLLGIVVVPTFDLVPSILEERANTT